MKKVDYTFDDVYVDYSSPGIKPNINIKTFNDSSTIMKRSVISNGLEHLKKLPDMPKKKSKKGKVESIELPEDVARDLEVLKMRSVLDPKHFYKKDKSLDVQKQVQIGKILDSPTDFYSSRIPKKLRKKTLVDELLADSNFKRYNKKRFVEIIEQRSKTHLKAHKYAKRLKKKK